MVFHGGQKRRKKGGRVKEGEEERKGGIRSGGGHRDRKTERQGVVVSRDQGPNIFIQRHAPVAHFLYLDSTS